jgi:hypothetical protein
VAALGLAAVAPFLYAVHDVSLTVTFWPADVASVNPDEKVWLTLPIDPPAAGPDRSLDPALPGPRNAGGAVAALALAGLLLDVALTIPYAPPATAATAMLATKKRTGLGENIACSFGV